MRRALLPALLFALFAAAAPVADAATKNMIRGRGWGHGIGMSQYGAYGLAQHGQDYRQILAHYYTGTELSKAGTSTIRVLLQQGRQKVFFTGATTIPGHDLDPSKTYYVRKAGLSSYELRTSGGKKIETYSGPVSVTSDLGTVELVGRALNGLSNGHYRGAIEIQEATFGGLVAVNAANLDDYVQGVVPGEMPSGWLPEALKAQAVAARSYALATDAGGTLFDQYPDTRSQVYRGADSEVASTNAAVQATSLQVLRYNGEIATTYFFSTSGGKTEDVQNVFYGAAAKPYLVAVDDPYDKISPHHTWRLTYSAKQIQARLGGLVKGRYRGIKIVQRGESPRIVKADIVGSKGKTRVTGATLKGRLGLDDTWASFARTTTKSSGRVARLGPGAEAGASFLDRLRKAIAGGPTRVYGTISPRPARRLIALERQGPHGWKKVRRIRTTRRGGYSALVYKPGLYRVRANGFAGPVVSIK